MCMLVFLCFRRSMVISGYKSLLSAHTEEDQVTAD